MKKKITIKKKQKRRIKKTVSSFEQELETNEKKLVTRWARSATERRSGKRRAAKGLGWPSSPEIHQKFAGNSTEFHRVFAIILHWSTSEKRIAHNSSFPQVGWPSFPGKLRTGKCVVLWVGRGSRSLELQALQTSGLRPRSHWRQCSAFPDNYADFPDDLVIRMSPHGRLSGENVLSRHVWKSANTDGTNGDGAVWFARSRLKTSVSQTRARQAQNPNINLEIEIKLIQSKEQAITNSNKNRKEEEEKNAVGK